MTNRFEADAHQPRSDTQLRQDVLAIWQAGVAAVQPENLIPQWVQVQGRTLLLGEHELPLDTIQRIAVIGVGKAGAGMAVALERALGSQLMQEKSLTGWVNVPADCVCTTERIHLHPARAAGVNEPTPEAVAGTHKILNILSQLGPNDLCLCLISGGGSAMLPMPVEGFTLEDKIELTRQLSASGATIHQINTIRRQLSQVKGGGLLRACRAGRMVSLILSDVLGDDLATIASGPTVPTEDQREQAILLLKQLRLANSPLGQRAIEAINRHPQSSTAPPCRATNLVIGNNAAAVDAAGVVAEQLGYSHAMTCAAHSEGPAEEVAKHLADMASSMRADGNRAAPDCLISGGEPTVKLVPAEQRGRGGRNQQLALAALTHLEDWRGLAFVSGGTDGEDGPTDAAGAVVDSQTVAAAREQNLAPGDYINRNDAYTFFDAVGGLVRTGPTGTNVCDLRVVCVSKPRP